MGHRSAQGWFVVSPLAGAGTLRGVQGEICMPEQLGLRSFVVRGGGDADARDTGDLVTVGAHRFADLAGELSCQTVGGKRIRDTSEQHRKLVTTQTRGQVLLGVV